MVTPRLRDRDHIKPPLDEAALPKTHGLFKRILVELSRNGTSGTIIAKCTGPKCGGHTQRVRVEAWRSGTCAKACKLCTAKE